MIHGFVVAYIYISGRMEQGVHDNMMSKIDTCEIVFETTCWYRGVLLFENTP